MAAVRVRSVIAAGLSRPPASPRVAAATARPDHGRQDARAHAVHHRAGTCRRRTRRDAAGRPSATAAAAYGSHSLGDFDQPVYVTQPPTGDDEHLYVVEQCGTILRVPIDGGEPQTFLELGDLVTCGGEQGLLSVAFDPGYAESGLLYVNYTDSGGRLAHGRVPALRRPAAADPGSARELLRIEDFASNHNGGLLMFGPDRELYLGMGDGGGSGDPERTAQDPDSPLGKLLRIDRSERRRLRGRGARAAQPVALLVRPRRPGSSGSATLARTRSRRSTRSPGRARSTAIRRPTSAGRRSRGPSAFNSDQQAPGAIPPVLEYGARRRQCSVTGGYVVRDPELDLALRPLPLRRLLRRRAAQLPRRSRGRAGRRSRARAQGRAAELVRRGRRRARVRGLARRPGLQARGRLSVLVCARWPALAGV